MACHICSSWRKPLNTAESLRSQFLLDPAVAFLNHGSFGACPLPVFEDYQRWQRELERQPVEFLGRRADERLDAARARLAAYIGASADDLIFVPNVTFAINLVARSLALQPDDEVLATDHEYGAMDYLWEFICARTGAHYRRQRLTPPFLSADEVVEALWRGVTPRTRAIFVSHITSPTALILPVSAICRRARAAGILTIVDGAHAPGHVPLDLAALDADFYAGNCHKWLCAPKGSGFLYARRDHHRWLEPLVISWGWLPEASFVTRNQWQGTRDLAAFLAVPAAIDFQAERDWADVRARCHDLARAARERLASLTSLEPIVADSPDWFGQMVTAPLPPCDAEAVKNQLYDQYRVEVPLVIWNGRPHIRLSFQGYNTPDDLERLLTGLRALL